MVNRFKKNALLFILWIAVFSTSCAGSNSTENSQISTSIEPIRYLIDQITGESININVLVPPGASPETYEPTPAQMRQLAESELYFQIGLIDFEQSLARGVDENMPRTKIVRLANGMDLIQGSCGHVHHNGHHHGIDPHIWTSPKCLKIIAKTVFDALTLYCPDSLHYKANYDVLQTRLESLDKQLESIFSAGNKHFMIYHPALAYLARDYGLTQIALEEEGKEPSAEHIRGMIDTARRWKIRRILYQQQFSRSVVEALARELEIEAVPIDPLGYEIEENLLITSRLIANP